MRIWKHAFYPPLLAIVVLSAVWVTFHAVSYAISSASFTWEVETLIVTWFYATVFALPNILFLAIDRMTGKSISPGMNLITFLALAGFFTYGIYESSTASSETPTGIVAIALVCVCLVHALIFTMRAKVR